MNMQQSSQQSSQQSAPPGQFTPGGLADQVTQGVGVGVGTGEQAQNPSLNRDTDAGDLTANAQAKSQQMMMDLKEQYQGIIASLSQFGQQVSQLAQTYPSAGQSLQPVIEQVLPQLGQVILQSMTETIQQLQAEPMVPSQV